MRQIQAKKLNKGFTLIELLVVVAIVAALLAISYPIIMRQVHTAKEVEARTTMRDILTSIQTYQDDNHGMLPQNLYNTEGMVSVNTKNITTEKVWLLKSLTGDSDGINNMRGKVYLDLNTPYVVRNKDGEIYQILDPWGIQGYQLFLNRDQTGEIDTGLYFTNYASGDNLPWKERIFYGYDVGIFCRGRNAKWDANAFSLFPVK